MEGSSAPPSDWEANVPDWRSFIPPADKDKEGDEFDWHVYVNGFD